MTTIDKQYDILREILKLFELSNGCKITDDGLIEDDNVERNIYIIITLPKTKLPKTNLQNYIYIFNAFENRTIQTPNNKISAMATFQSIYVLNNTNNIKTLACKIKGSNDITYINDINMTPTYNNLTSPYAMGDPHITQFMVKNMICQMIQKFTKCSIMTN